MHGNNHRGVVYEKIPEKKYNYYFAKHTGENCPISKYLC